MKNNKMSKWIYISTLGLVAVLGLVLLLNKEQIFHSGKIVSPVVTPTPLPEVVIIDDSNVPTAPTMGELIKETKYDQMIIPDKYNTGAKGELKKVSLGDTVEGIKLKVDGTGTKNIFDFAYSNKNISGMIEIRDYDFSDKEVVFYNEDKVERQIKLVFVNCIFSKISKGAGESRLLCEFSDCTIQNFSGGNALFERCHFGYSPNDGLNPYNDVQVLNCFFSNLSDILKKGKGIHTDGTQLYGKQNIIVENIKFFNCRFEMPAINTGENSAYINACIMLQLEYSSGKKIEVNECILNGGGYSMYAHAIKGTNIISDVTFSNIFFGCAKRFGSLYPDVSNEVSFREMSDTQNLYVASVWKQENKVHLSVSNDTNQERILKVYTDRGEFEFSIAACPNGEQLDKYSAFEEFPFDIDIMIPEDCDYVVCYDATTKGNEAQIRFVNWSGKDVYVAKGEEEKIDLSKEVVISGECGKSASFELTQDGTLTIRGTGSTYDYHSAKPTPWNEYKYLITRVRIEEGIERLGNQLFNKYSAISKVDLPDGLISFGTRTFGGCTSLLELTLPASMNELGNSALAGAAVFSIYCSEEQFERFKSDTTIAPKLKIKTGQ